MGERQPLLRSQVANEVWSIDFVFECTAEGRPIKCLTVVDNSTHKSVAVVPDRAVSSWALTRILDQLHLERGLPHVIRTDNRKEFCSRAMLTWAYQHQISLRLIEPSKPNQNAYVESFDGRLRYECLNEHWFTSLAHAQAIIEDWRRDYNEGHPTKGLGGLPPPSNTQSN